MQLENSFWYFKKAIGEKTCDDIIKYGNSQEEQLALTGATKKKKPEELTQKELLNLKEKRDSNVAWLNDTWIYQEILGFVRSANENAGWNFEWDWAEACQFTKYRLNQYYDWHCDSWEKPYDESNGSNFTGKIRKLSVTVNLTDGNDYEGGELEFDLTTPENKRIIAADDCKAKGTVIVFPSHMWHRVKPVTKGTRYSLVVWCVGRPFQ